MDPPSPRRPGIPLARARAVAGRLLGPLAREESTIRLATAGDMRRMAPRVEGIVLVATAHDVDALLAAFLGHARFEGRRHPDLDLAVGRAEGEVPAVLRVLPEDDTAFAAQVLWLTARKDHFAALAAAADARGLVLDPGGLWRGPERLETPSGAAVYDLLGQPYVPAELREGAEIVAPPEDLLEPGEVRGLGLVHTDRGLGRHGIARMAERAAREGYRWMLLADAALDDAARGEIAAAERLAAEAGTPLTIAWAVVVPAAGAPEDLLVRLSAPGVKVLAPPREDDDAGWSDDLAAWEPILDVCADRQIVPAVSGSAAARPLPAGWDAAVRARGLDVLAAADARDLAGIDDQICALGALRRGRWTRDRVVNTREAFA